MVDTFNVLGIIALALIAGLLYLAHLSNRRAADMTRADYEASQLGCIQVGDALFTAQEYARIVQLHVAYHEALTTGGDKR